MTDPHTLTAVLMDAGGVLYHRPRQDRHLTAFLEGHGLTLRHRRVADRALRAALFDVRSGRIDLDTFYDAVLRVHGIEDEALFPAGREALLQDAADIELYPGVRETLDALEAAGIRLGVVSDSGHVAGEKIAWLAQRGLSPSLWAAFVVSSEVGSLKLDCTPFTHALDRLEVPADAVAFVGHATEELRCAGELGMTTIAFMPDDLAAPSDHVIGSFYGLGDLLLGPTGEE